MFKSMIKYRYRICSVRGMSVIEQVVLFTVIVAALIAMMVWVKRTVSSKYQEVGARIGAGRQYAP
jgi:Flp pilus assembly pilin Flp